MADGKTVTIKIETVAGNTSGAKKVISDLEKEVMESQKRVQASSRATDRAILQSQTANINAGKAAAKQQANEFIRNMKQMESEAKRSSGSIRSSLENAFSGAFGGGLIGGAVGGFAGNIVGMFAQQFAQIPSLLRTQLDEAIKIASERQNALKGLISVAAAKGIAGTEADAAVKNLRLVRSGIIDVTDATTSLKNLLATGFSLPQAVKLLEAFSDSAAFGKQSALSYGEAIRGATEGVKNQNSVLVDNAGITKNLSIILKEAGFSAEDLGKVTTDNNVRLALYNGLLKEASINVGDADRLTQGWTGTTAALNTAQRNLYASIGDIIVRNPDLLAALRTTTGQVNDLTTAFGTAESSGTKLVNSLTSSFAKWTVDLNAMIAKEVADIRELGNALSILSSAIGFAGTAATDSLGITNYGYGRQLQQGLNQRGTFYKESTDYELKLRKDFNENLRKQLPETVRNLTISRSGAFGNTPLTSAPSTTIGPGQPGYFGTTASPGTMAGGNKPASAGVGRRLPRTKSPRVNINLKDEMSDALDIAARFGLTVTSGSEGKHNPGSSHYDKTAFDFRTTGMSPYAVGAAIKELQEAGYSVKDERTHPPGQAVWSGPHIHVSGTNRRKNAGRADREIEQFKRDIPAMFGGDFTQQGAFRFGRPVEVDASGDVVTFGDLGKDRRADRSGLMGRDDLDLSSREKEIKQNETLADLYGQMADALFNLNEHTKEEIFLREAKLGKYGDLTDAQIAEIANTYKLIDAQERLTKEREAQDEAARKAAEAQQQYFDDVRNSWEDLLTDLSRGDFKSIWRRLKDEMFSQFIRPASDALAQLFTGMRGGGQQGQQGGIGGLFGSLFGGGGMGPGGTPMFNPTSGGQQQGGSGGLMGLLQSLFGGFGGNRVSSGGGVALGSNLPGGVPAAGNFSPSAFYGFGGSNDQMGGAAGGLGGLHEIGNIFGGGAAGGGGLSGFLRNIGGGSRMAGIGSGLGAIGMMAGQAIGGKWGNMLSLTGMGAQIGANFGPWGAAIGAGIGAGAGLIAMLFGKDSSIKKLKEAAASEWGISVKDKSILKQLQQIGDQYFGQGQAGKNAVATVHTEEGMNILKAYAESSGQSSLKIDRLNYGDESWSGNQFRSQFGGFRAMGGPVKAGMAYVVGEKGPEVFTPTNAGTITPNGSRPVEMDAALADAIYELKDILATFRAIPKGAMLEAAVAENPEAVTKGFNQSMAYNPRAAENSFRATGAWSR